VHFVGLYFMMDYRSLKTKCSRKYVDLERMKSAL